MSITNNDDLIGLAVIGGPYLIMVVFAIFVARDIRREERKDAKYNASVRLRGKAWEDAEYEAWKDERIKR